LQNQQKQLEREVDQLKSRLASSAGKDLAQQAKALGQGSRLLVANVGGVEPKALRGMVDQLKDRLQSAVILLAAISDDKISLVSGVTADLVGQIKAGDLVRQVAQQVGGKGGGRPD